MSTLRILASTQWVRYAVTLVIAAAMIAGISASAGVTRAETLDADVDAVTGVDVFANDLQLGNRDLRSTVASIINVALSLLGIIAVVVIIIGGFFWMTAGGNEEQVGKAKGWIFSGIIGLAIILSAFAISSFVLRELGKATELRNVGP